MTPLSTRRHIESALSTVAEMLRLKNEVKALRVMTLAEVELDEVSYDNRNGGTGIWTAHLRIPVDLFVSIENEVDCLVKVIDEHISTVLGRNTAFCLNVEIGPKTIPSPNFKSPDGNISANTRAAILDEMRAKETIWYGDVNEVDFLNRIFQLTELPSCDSRFETAEDEIRQHRINDVDWSLDWIFVDSRFSLYELDQETFLKFISEILNPTVREDYSEQTQLAAAFNRHLKRDGWELVEDERINGHPKYEPERTVRRLNTSTQRIKAVAASLNSSNLYEDLRRLERVGDTEPGEAIGLAKEIVESCCKLILDDRSVSYREKADIPELLKLLRKEIQIMPQGIDENAKAANEIREVLTSLGKIAHSLGIIRNAYGKGHGRGRDFRSLEPRHARLAVGAASTFVDFVLNRHLSLQKGPKR